MNPPPLTFAGSGRLAALVIVTVLAGCGGRDEAPAEPLASLTVAVTSPTMTQLDRVLTVSGSVAAWQEMSLGVELAGIRIAEVLVEVGDRCAAGSRWCASMTRTLEVQARQADAALAQAQASLTLARADSDPGRVAAGAEADLQADCDVLTANLLRPRPSCPRPRPTARRPACPWASRPSRRPRMASSRPGRPAGPGRSRPARSCCADPRRPPGVACRARREGPDPRDDRHGRRACRPRRRARHGPGPDRRAVPRPGQTRTGLVYADLPEPGVLRAGMFAQGRIVLGTSPALVVPRESIVFRDGLPYVFVTRPQDGAGDGNPVVKVEQRRIRPASSRATLPRCSMESVPPTRSWCVGPASSAMGTLVRVAPAKRRGPGRRFRRRRPFGR
jgi:hypothetical protein